MVADQDVSISDLLLEVVEDRRDLLGQRLIDERGVRLLLQEVRRDEALEEDRRQDLDDLGVRVLFDPQGAAFLIRQMICLIEEDHLPCVGAEL